jgi:hypothetical protein
MDAMDGVGLGAPGEAARADFGAFFTARHRELALLAYEQSGQRIVAEEITADAFAEAWRRWQEISRADSPAAAMREIVDRLAEGRVRRSAAGLRQDPYEPDAARIWDLTSERIALIPRQKAAATMLASGGAGVDDGAPRTASGGNGRFRRPGPIGIVIGVNAIAAVVAIVVTATTVGSSGHDNHVTVSLAETNTVTAQGAEPDSPNQAATATGYTPSHSASASASPSPTADQPTNTDSALASTPPTASVAANAGASPSVSATTSPVSNAGSTSSADLLTASGSVNVYSSATWTQLNVAADVTQPLSAMTITIQVADCTDLAETGEWDSGADSEFNPTSTTNANGSITYRFQLNSGDEATPGDVSFAVQFSHTATGWSASADSYSVTAVSASSGATDDLGGGF